jgi:hypothetical protein
MIISREWAMPNKNTFSILPIRKLINKYNNPQFVSCDPFSNKSTIATVRNDMNPIYKTEWCMDSTEFMKLQKDEYFDLILYDPPYSLRQVSECYKNVGKEVTMQTTQSSWRGKHLDEIQRITKLMGIVICFGWNSNGVGIKRGFEMIEILIVAHGGSHNDTICTVERKLLNQEKLF